MIIVNTASFDRIARELRAMPQSIPKAVSRAINDTIRQTRTAIWREIKPRYNVRQTAVYGTIRMAFSSASAEEMKGAIASYSARFPLYTFGKSGAKLGSKRPVTVEIKRGDRKEVKHAFAAQMESGHIGIFGRLGAKRKMLKGRYAGKMRQPISELFTISVAEMLRAESGAGAWRAVTMGAEEAFERNANKQIAFWLEKSGKGEP